MSEMVERVALATRKKVISMDPGKWPEMESNPNAPLHLLELEIARAAIAAMREPTEAMLKVPAHLFATRSMEWTDANRKPIWQAMIDAALK